VSRSEVSQTGTTRVATEGDAASRAPSRRPSVRRQGASQVKVEDPSDVPAVGHVLRRAREYWDLSLRDVERRIGRSNAYLSQVERGVIRRPDPVLLLELADLYRLDFTKLAAWAGWSEPSEGPADESLAHVLRLALQLNESQRTQLLAHIEGLLREDRS
jgi:transcriptional regulator with XRE-family HTH domain